MKISVIIPVYNGEKWVAQCIENMLAQSHKELEIIVIDDGSTDGTAAIAAKYPVTLISQANGGLSAARNSGLNVATGDYVHFMDVDDWINLDYYARLAEAAELSGAEVVYGGMIHEALPGLTRLYSERWSVSVHEDRFRLTNAIMQGSACRYIISRALMEKHGMRFEVGRYVEDMPFTVRAVLEANKIVTVPGAVYYYKFRSGSIMRTRDPERKRKRKTDLAAARATCRELLGRHGAENVPMKMYAEENIQYKLLGIPVLEKRLYNGGKARWFLFGLYVLQVKQLGQRPE